MQRYFSSALLCFRLLLSNLPLLIPDALLIVLTSLLFFGVVYVNGLHTMFTLAETEFQEVLRTLLTDTPRLVQLVVTGLIALALNVFVGLTLVAARLEMIQSVLAKKALTFFAAYRKGRALLWRLFCVKFLITLIYVFVGLIFIGVFFRFLGSDLSNLSIPALVFLFIALGIFLILKLLFLFVYPHLVYQKKSVLATLRSTCSYTLLHKCHVFFVGITILLINLFAQVILSLLSNLTLLLPIIASFVGLLGLVIGLFLVVWATLFIFTQYSFKA